MSDQSDVEDEMLVGDFNLDVEHSYDDLDDNTSGLDDGNGFLELEAVESGDDEEDEDEHDHADEAYAPFPEHEEQDFPQFIRLPIEIRQLIWEAYCPDLAANSRIYELSLDCPVPRKEDVWESAVLMQQTAPSRTVLSVHRESRAVALRVLPDILPFRNGKAMIHFNKAKDIVCIAKHSTVIGVLSRTAFSESVVNLALKQSEVLVLFEETFLEQFPNLKVLYDLKDDDEVEEDRHLLWCPSDSVNHYVVQTFEEEPGLGEDLQYTYCWPDINAHREFAKWEIPLHDLIPHSFIKRIRAGKEPEHPDEYPPGDSPDFMRVTRDIQHWPMVRFCFESGAERLRYLENRNALGADWISDEDPKSNSNSESGTDQDEYESEGIDDGDIEEDDANSNEDDLEVLPLSESEDHEGPSSPFGGFSPVAAGALDPATLGGDLSNAQFSSPEPEEIDGQDDERESSEASDAEEADRRKQSRAQRRIVALDDSDEESDGEEVRQPSTSANRRPRIVLSDSEEEDEDDDDEVIEMGAQRKGVASDVEHSSVDPSDSEEDAGEARPLSLAERLQLHRQDNPVESDDESGTEDGGDYDLGGNEDEDDEDEQSDNNLLADMAEDSDGDGHEDF